MPPPGLQGGALHPAADLKAAPCLGDAEGEKPVRALEMDAYCRRSAVEPFGRARTESAGWPTVD
eukprot:359622-Chlamydomonas_euryale.AAC.15